MDVTDQDFKKVIEMIKYLNDGENLEKYLDVEEIYEKDGAFSILPWDLNLSFEGFHKQEMCNK
ncbi:hypothetical protein [Garciella nitratireducens]|uniref:hypothetical protein n=1 Tax=Garciella nitratireducens TaxID=218205 RepID=UPI001BD2FED9|nr:hypothetical protein [Garciella nitratireducens]